MKTKGLKPTPVDTGWSWVILASSFFCYGLSVGSLKCFGLLYAELLDMFGRMASTTAVIPSLHIFAIQISGLPANYLTTKVGIKNVVIIGGVLCAVGYFTTAFVPDLEYMYMTSAISGTGIGFILSPTLAITNQYFLVHRAKTTSILTASSSVFMFILPHLYKYFIDQYFMRGALVLIAGTLLHICVFASFFREPVLRNVTNNESHSSVTYKTEHYDVDVNAIVDEKDLTDEETGSHLKNKGRKNFIPGNSGMSKRYAEQVPLTEKTEQEDLSEVHIELEQKESSSTQFQKFHFSLIKVPTFLYIGFSFLAALSGYNIVMIILPAYAQSLTEDPDASTTVVSIVGGAETVSMLCIGWFIDLKIVTCKTIWSCCLTVAGVSMIFAYFARSMVSLYIISTIYGATVGTLFLLRSLVLIEGLGLNRLISGLGLLTLFTAVGALVSSPLAGLIKDTTGSWNGACILGGSLLICGAFTMQMDTIHKRCTRTDSAESKDP